MGRPVNPAPEQRHYRWYNDDGDVCANTAKAAADTKITEVNQGDILRLIVMIDQPNAADLILDGQLEYSEDNKVSWKKVPLPADLVDEWFEIYDSSYALNCAALTEAMGYPKTGTAPNTWENGHYHDTQNPAEARTLNTETTELEVCIKATTNLPANKTVFFRYTDAGTELTTYTVYPELDSFTVASLTWTDYGTYIQFDKSKYSNISKITFEVRIRYGEGSYEAHARLYNVSDGAVVTGSEVTSTSPSYEFKESADIQANLPNLSKIYKVEIGAYTGEVVYLKGARIKVELVVV